MTTTEPAVSIVVASGAGGEFLFRCLASLRDQADIGDAEIIVVDRVGLATRERIAREFPAVRVVSAPDDHRATVPELRRLGLDAARAPIVAVLEEHCEAPPRWLEAIRTNMTPADAAVGGPILPDRLHRLRDWVVYFSEYHNFMPPWPPGDRYLLNGANIAYRAEGLAKYRADLDSGYWEVVLHPRLAQDGRFRALDAMGAYHTGPFDYGYYLRQRYLLSRVWGGTEKDRVSGAVRAVHIVVAPVFPLLLLARIAVRVVRAPRFVGRFVATLPLLIPVLFAYTIGETTGYLVGPGRALEEVE